MLEILLEKDGIPLLMGLGMGEMQRVHKLPAQPGLKLKGRQLYNYQLIKGNCNG